MSTRLRFVAGPAGPLIRVAGSRRHLVLLPGDDGTIRWRSTREVRSWRRHFGTMRRDVEAVTEALAAHGLALCVAGEWPRAVEIAKGGR